MTIYADASTEKTAATMGYGAELLKALRRRREAALRLPPLPHNRRRDPAGSPEICGGV